MSPDLCLMFTVILTAVLICSKSFSMCSEGKGIVKNLERQEKGGRDEGMCTEGETH